MKQQIIDLWKDSFGDSDEFIELFFSRVYKDQNTLTIRKNNQVIAALQMIPYQMTYCGTPIPVGYICGVCTSPAERGKGWMKQLMQEAIDEMNRRNYALTVLIPASEWLFGYYNKFGYTTVFDKSEEIHTLFAKDGIDSLQIVSQSEILFEDMYTYYNRVQQKRECAILHSTYDFKTILLDCLAVGGDCQVALQNKQVVGLALAVPTDENHVLIKEIIYDYPEVKTTLIQAILSHFQKETAKVRVSPTPADSKPYGMARILDKERILILYQSHKNTDHTDKSAYANIEQLTEKLLFYNQKKAFMNLMLD